MIKKINKTHPVQFCYHLKLNKIICKPAQVLLTVQIVSKIRLDNPLLSLFHHWVQLKVIKEVEENHQIRNNCYQEEVHRGSWRMQVAKMDQISKVTITRIMLRNWISVRWVVINSNKSCTLMIFLLLTITKPK